jgi:atypical dual specificity phosphatase
VHGPRYDLEALRSVGVTRLISLTEEPFSPVLASDFGISCLASPMPDMHPPTIEQALDLCRAIDAALAAGEVIAVHCRAGLGRTGTVLAAYWLWRGCGAIGALKALEHVRRIEPGWVQSLAQVKFLEEFALVVASHTTGLPVVNDPETVLDEAVCAL